MKPAHPLALAPRPGGAARIVAALFALATPGAGAQPLLETEGIELRGAAAIEEPGAATCSVSEARESASSYEARKANHGQPLDLWRLDFSVYNGSGRPLDHLIADYRIASGNLPCTDWSWPGAGRYPGRIGWGNLAGLIQRSGTDNPTEAGETLTDTKYILAFRGREPRFETAGVDFTFATDTFAAGPPAPVPAGPGPVAPAGPQPLCGPQPSAAGCWRNVAYRADCHVWVTRNLDQTIGWSGECSEGYAQGTGTLEIAYGRLVQGTPARTAQGLLVDGRRQGNWTTRMTSGRSFEGPFVDGREHGYWVLPRADGGMAEGFMRHGKRHGDWLEREADGTIRKGPYVTDDSGPLSLMWPQGRWVNWYPNGIIDAGALVRNRRQGAWTSWQPDGSVGEYSYVDDQRHGLTIFCFPRPGMTLVRVDIHEEDELKFTYLQLEDIPDPELMTRVVLECARLISMEPPERPA